jgi:eukaryotic-like serine/threonine-protein kinase
VDPAEAPPPDPLADPRVFQAIQDYQAEIDAGRRPDRAEFVSRYPDVAEEVAGCLDGFDFLRAASPRATHHGHSGSALATESRLGEFHLLREVGRGGMGVVYEAEQPSLGRRVALKVVAGPALDDRTRQRFRNEAHAAASLHHPHIVPVYAIGAEGESLFLAMQFVAGRSLAAVVRQLQCPTDPAAETPPNTAPDTGPYPSPPTASAEKAEPLPFPAPPAAGYYRATARLAADAAAALQHAHDLGIVHRDVKPGNLLVEPTGHLWVADFGLARLPGSGDLTRTGEMIGTLRYMSPEQVAGAAVDHRTDVYSLGATLYELLTLHPAFPGTDPHDVLRRIASEEPPAPRALAPAVPRDLETVVLKAMAKEPVERYATAREFAADLARFLEDRPLLARRPSLAHRVRKWVKRNRALVAVGLAGLIVFLAATAVGLAIAADAIRDEQRLTAKANDELKGKNTELDQTVGALNRSTADLNKANTDLGKANTNLTAALREARQAEYTYRFLAARREWQAGNFGRARDLLEECPAEFRRWEWGYLRELLAPGLYALPGGVQSGENASSAPLVFSGDGTRLAHLHRTVRVWELPADRSPPAAVRWTFERPGCVLVAAAFTPDGARLVAAGYVGPNWGVERVAGEVSTWDLATGERVSSFPLPGKPLAVSPDGARVLCAPNARLTARLIGTADGKPVPGSVEVPASAISLTTFSPFGRYLAFPSGTAIRLHDGRTGEEVRVIAGAQSGGYPVAFSPDERRLATPSFADQPARTWDAETGQEVQQLRGRTVLSPAFSPDGRRLAAKGADGTIEVWDVSPTKLGPVFRPRHVYHGPSLSPVFHPDGLRVAAADAAGRVVLWDVTTDHEGRILPPLPGYHDQFTPTADGARVIRRFLPVPPHQPQVEFARDVDLATGREVRRVVDPVTRIGIPVHGAGRARLGAPDGLFLQRPSAGGAWSLRCPTADREWPIRGDGTQAFTHAAVAPDGSVLAAVESPGKGSAGGVQLFDTGTGARRKVVAAGAGVTAVEFDPRNPALAVGCADGTIRLFDPRDGSPIRTLTGHAGAVAAVTFHPTDAVLVSAGADGSVRVWDAATGACVRTVEAHAGGLVAVAFTTDGDRLAVCLRNGTVQLWDHRTGEEYLTVTTHGAVSPVKTLVFTAGDRFLVGGGSDPHVWDAAPADVATRVRRLTERAPGWYERESRKFENRKDWPAAVFHLERLVGLEPTNAGYAGRLAAARAALAAAPPKP